MRGTFRSTTIATAVAVLVVSLSGCDTIEYRDRAPFNPPPDQVNGFLGYYTAATKQTTCGNCHATTQKQWLTYSPHAQAWSALPANAASYCKTCHTVSGNGNGRDSAGYDKVPSPAYHDVQCESCHGPGQTHVSNPDGGTVPLAHMSLHDTLASCGACHSGAHEPFVEQWAASGHGDSAANSHPATTAGCQGCHEGKAALARFGGSSVYAEASSANTQTITCVVCHDPHGTSNTASLRLPITSPDPTVNLCMQCHWRSTTPTSSFNLAAYGAHAVQGAVLLGAGAGWIPPGFIYDSAGAYTTHGSAQNPLLCAGCHVHPFAVTDSNGLVFQSVGHLFRPAPCVDGSGVPIADNSCAYTSTARNWSSCTQSGCHADASVVANLFNNERATVAGLVDQLWNDVNHNGKLDAFPTDSGYLAQIYATTPTELTANTNGLTTAEGGLFNAQMLAEASQYSHSDGSYGAHNPFFYEALLSATVNAVKTQYGLAPPPPAIQAAMDRALARPAVHYAPPRPRRLAQN
jgi:predicted CXXCH cytochrome family protein